MHIQFAYAIDDMCDNLQSGESVCVVTEKFANQLWLFYFVPNYGYYYFNLVNCYKQDATVDVYATLLNPGNNHLTATLVPVPADFTDS